MLDLFAFLEFHLSKIQKLRIVLAYYLFSRFNHIKILGMQLSYGSDSKNHYLLILKEIFLNQIYSFTKTTDLKLKAHPGVIIDVGANIGLSVAYFKNKYPETKLIAIEASPINYLYLENNIKVNNFNNIKLINCFVSNENKIIEFYHDMNKPGGSFGKDFKSKDSPDLIKFEIRAEKLTNFISGQKNIVIKIDAEGSEYVILSDIASSKNISEVIEITAEVTASSQADLNNLNNVMNDFHKLGFESRFISNYSIKALRNASSQGHLQLVLFRNITEVVLTPH